MWEEKMVAGMLQHSQAVASILKHSQSHDILILMSWADISIPIIWVMILFSVTNHGMISSLASKTTVLGQLSQLHILQGFNQSSWIFNYNFLKMIDDMFGRTTGDTDHPINGIFGRMIDGTHQPIVCFGFFNYNGYCTGQQICCCTCSCTTLSTSTILLE